MQDVNFGTRLSVRLIEGVRLIGGPLNRGFNVVGQQYRDKPTLPS